MSRTVAGPAGAALAARWLVGKPRLRSIFARFVAPAALGYLWAVEYEMMLCKGSQRAVQCVLGGRGSILNRILRR